MSDDNHLHGDYARYIGKRLLVGISYEDEHGKLLRQEQFHGVIVEVTDGGIILRRSDTGALETLPPGLQEAPQGHYRLRSTGEVVIDPDYLAKWVMKDSPPDQADR